MPGGDAPSASAVIRLTIPKTFGGDTAHLKLVEVGSKVPGRHCGLFQQLGLGALNTLRLIICVNPKLYLSCQPKRHPPLSVVVKVESHPLFFLVRQV